MNRIKNKITDISYNETNVFFENRAQKYNEENPYVVTMYQDKHPEIVNGRNEAEMKILLPKLGLDNNSIVLDIGCGIGRWADAIKKNTQIKEYIGIDFSENLIGIANRRNTDNNFNFYVGSATKVNDVIKNNSLPNIVLLIGLIMYMNDDDISILFRNLCCILHKDTKVIMREPIGISDRLTLKNFHSDELNANYNAIYRTREEIIKLMEPTMLKNGFVITEEGFLFDDSLNNRKETSQYYFILERIFE